MDKVEKDGKVAVLFSPGFGAGWSSWATDENKEAMCMDARLVETFLREGSDGVVAVVKELFPGEYTGGAKDLKIHWVPKGFEFEITEYDGSESIHVIGHRKYLVA